MHTALKFHVAMHCRSTIKALFTPLQPLKHTSLFDPPKYNSNLHMLHSEICGSHFLIGPVSKHDAIRTPAWLKT